MQLALACGAFALATVLAAYAAYPVMFMSSAPYDDEGYLLVSLKGFRSGAPLYDEVFTQYGPFYYAFMSALLSLLGAGVSHDTGRLVTIGIWLAAALLSGVTVWRVSRSVWLGCCFELLAFQSLFVMVAEPMHPGGLLCLVLASIPAAAVLLLPARRRAALLWIGGAAAAAALTKINVGGFVFLAIAFAAGQTLATRRLPRLAVAFLVTATPFVLMAGSLDQQWARAYALHVAVAAAALAVASRPPSDAPTTGGRDLAALAIGALATATVLSAFTLLRGSSVGRLLHGVLLQPLMQPQVLTVPLVLPRLAPVVGLLGLGAAAIAPRSSALIGALRRRHPRLPAVGDLGWLAGAARILAGLAIASSVAGVFLGRQLGFALLPLAWVAAVPPARDDAGRIDPFARSLLAALAVLQALHAYPVAGSQVQWGSFLLLVVAGVCIADGMAQLARWAAAGAIAAAVTPRAMAAAGALLLAGVSTNLILLVQPYWAAYRTTEPLPLPGAGRLHLRPQLARDYVWLCEELRRSCSTFVSLPGLNGLYLLAGLEPPTWQNHNAWMFLFDESTQQRIVERLAQRDRLCLVLDRDLAGHWARGRPLPPGPLLTFMASGFEPLGSRSGVELLVRRPAPGGDR